MISVIVPSYNSAPYIGNAIASVLRQGFGDFEIVIQDACSTDATESIIRSFGDARIRFNRERDRGQSHALNMAIAKATGEWVVWLNADDLLHPQAFSSVVPLLDSSVDLVYGDFDIVDRTGELLKSYTSPPLDFRRLILRGCYVFSGATVWRKSVINQSGGFDESLHYTMDYELFLRVARFVRARHCPATIASFRRHEGGTTTARPWPMFREDLRIRRRYAQSPADLALATYGILQGGAYILTRRLWHSAAWRRIRPYKRL